MELPALVAKNLEGLRLGARLSQQQLAKVTGLSARYISRLENTSPNITLDVLARLAKGLGCTPAEIVAPAKGNVATSARTNGLLRAVDHLANELGSFRKLLAEE